MRRRRVLALALALAAARVRAAVDYPDAIAGTPLRFPADEGAHPEFRNEWWYVTGWLRDAQAHERGFQLTFFRNRPGVAEESASRFAPRQLLFAHAALADPALQRLRFDERAAREDFGLALAATGRTGVRIGDWSLAQDGERFDVRIRARTFALDVALEARQPVLLQGDGGLSRKGPDLRDASWYYSRPQLRVRGALTLDEQTHDVTGVAWLDHEWSSRYLPQSAVGWDWTGINFDDGAALMAFRIRDRSGRAVWAGGAWRDARGATRILAPQDVDFQPLRRWRSPQTAIEYPVSFRIRAGGIDAVLEPLMDDQELDARAGVGVIYWEGAVHAIAGGNAAGRGYLELTGYGEPLRI